MTILDYAFQASKWNYDFPEIYVVAQKAKRSVYAATGGKTVMMKPKWRYFIEMQENGVIYTDSLMDAKWSSFVMATWHRNELIAKYGDEFYTYTLKKLHWWNLLTMKLRHSSFTTKKMCNLKRLHI